MPESNQHSTPRADVLAEEYRGTYLWEQLDNAKARIAELEEQLEALQRERDWWRERYMLDVKPDVGEVARLDYEAAEFADSNPASSLSDPPSSTSREGRGSE